MTGNPTNVVLCEAFSIKYIVFSAYTIFPFLGCFVTGFIALYLQFYKGHIPKTVAATQLDPRSALRDPVGALVGSIWLLATLILLTGTGFAGIIV